MIDVESDDDFYSNDEDAVTPCLNSKEIAKELDCQFDKPNRTRKRRRVYWSLELVFENYQEAFKSIEQKWKKTKEHGGKNGLKQYFKCSLNINCKAMMHLHILNDCQTINMLRNQEEHNHDFIANSNKRLRIEIKEKIFELYELRITQPLNIIYSLRKQGFTNLPSPVQITNLIARTKRKKQGKPAITYKEFLDYCKANSAFPSDPNKGFIVNYEVVANKESYQYIRMVVSTLYLLELASKNIFACIDATYQLVYQGHPVIMCGHVDKNKQFHPTCLAITTSQNNEDFFFIINSIKTKIHEIFEKEYEIQYFLADAADEITIAIQNAYPNACRLVCWAHVERAISPKSNPIDEDLLKDINKIQLSHSVYNFNSNIKLFFDKWGLEEEADLTVRKEDSELIKFLKYFKKEWIVSKHCNWYEGIAPAFPSTNNALESTNKVLKDTHTLREREQLSRFMKSISVIVETWSFDRSSEVDRLKTFFYFPSVSSQLWEATQEYLDKKPKIKYIPEYDLYLVSKNETIDESYEMYYETIECELTNCQCYRTQFDFDQYFILNNSIKKVKLNKAEWQFSKCTCKAYFKDYLCKHIAASAVKTKLVEIDFSFKTIGMKKKRGRKAKAKDWFFKDTN